MGMPEVKMTDAAINPLTLGSGIHLINTGSRNRSLTAAERMRIGSALGRDVLKVADALQLELSAPSHAPVASCALLRAPTDGAGSDAMSSPLGMAVQLAVLGKI